MIDLEKAERSLRRTGTAYHEDIHVKIVPRGDGFGVETTVKGDRRYPTEDAMPIEEAIRLALAQLVEPRAEYRYVPSPESDQPTPRAHLPYMAVGDLADLYKAKGLDRYRGWDQYVKDTILQPLYRSESVNAKEFYKGWR